MAIIRDFSSTRNLSDISRWLWGEWTRQTWSSEWVTTRHPSHVVRDAVDLDCCRQGTSSRRPCRPSPPCPTVAAVPVPPPSVTVDCHGQQLYLTVWNALRRGAMMWLTTDLLCPSPPRRRQEFGRNSTQSLPLKQRRVINPMTHSIVYGYCYKASCARPCYAVICNFWHQGWASECPDVKNYKWRLNPVWYRILYVPIWQQWASKG